jgi:hypothetical protein
MGISAQTVHDDQGKIGNIACRVHTIARKLFEEAKSEREKMQMHEQHRFLKTITACVAFI